MQFAAKLRVVSRNNRRLLRMKCLQLVRPTRIVHHIRAIEMPPRWLADDDAGKPVSRYRMMPDGAPSVVQRVPASEYSRDGGVKFLLRMMP